MARTGPIRSNLELQSENDQLLEHIKTTLLKIGPGESKILEDKLTDSANHATNEIHWLAAALTIYGLHAAFLSMYEERQGI